jgi:hypothetical protein
MEKQCYILYLEQNVSKMALARGEHEPTVHRDPVTVDWIHIVLDTLQHPRY